MCEQGEGKYQASGTLSLVMSGLWTSQARRGGTLCGSQDSVSLKYTASCVRKCPNFPLVCSGQTQQEPELKRRC